MLHLQARADVLQEQRDRCATAIESFLVRRMACNLTTKDYNRLFLSLLPGVQTFGGTEVGEHVEQALAEQTAPSRYWPDDGKYISALLGENIDRVLKGPRLRVLLGGMEAALRLNKSEMGFVPANVERLSVEHLLPQQWTSHYPLPDDAEADALERRERAVHRLGNLTLTTTKLNSSVSNGPWSIKRRELNQHAVLLLTAGSVLQAPPSLEDRLGQDWAQTWDEQRIDLRGLYLTSLAMRAWPRPETTEAFEATRDKCEEVPNDLQAAVSRGAMRYGDIAGHIASGLQHPCGRRLPNDL